MAKKTITISSYLINTIFIGFLLSIFIVFIVHLFGDWSISTPQLSNSFGSVNGSTQLPMNTQISRYDLHCPLNEIHVFDGKGATVNDIIGEGFNGIKFGAYISSTFDGHLDSIILIWIMCSILLYIIGKVNFKIV